MALIECSECGHMVSENAKSCPNCGNPIKSNKGLNWKTPILSFVLLLLVLGGAYSVWHLIRNNGEQNGDIEITAKLSEAVHRYDEVSNFHEGLSAVCKNNKWGYINSKGDEVIPCKYESACDFSEGLACVYLTRDDNMPIAFINNNGNTVISGYYGGSRFERLIFKNGKCLVMDKDKNGFYIDKEGNRTDEPNNIENGSDEMPDVEIFYDNDKMGVKDTLGNIIVQAKYSYIDDFSEGLAVAYLYCSDDKNIYGFVDKKGNSTFTESDFVQLAKHEKQRQEEAKRAEEERLRQEEENRRKGKEIIISMSADVSSNMLCNKNCNIGDVSNRWDQLISKKMRVSEGKVVVFKYAEVNREGIGVDFVRIFVNGSNSRTYEALSCGEFPIMEGESFNTLIHTTYMDNDGHIEAKFHFREIDKDFY